MGNKKDRTGECGITNEGERVEIIKYNSFSDIEVKISDDYKFKEGMKCIKASVMVGGTVSRFNGFVRVLFYKAV